AGLLAARLAGGLVGHGQLLGFGWRSAPPGCAPADGCRAGPSPDLGLTVLGLQTPRNGFESIRGVTPTPDSLSEAPAWYGEKHALMSAYTYRTAVMGAQPSATCIAWSAFNGARRDYRRRKRPVPM